MKLFGKKEESEHETLLKIVKAIRKDTKPERERMSRNLKIFEGRAQNLNDPEFENHDKPSGRSFVHYNTVFATIQSIAPMVTDSRPITKVAPKHPWAEKLGIQLNGVLKYAWDVLDMQMKMYRGVMNSMIFDPAIFKIGYDLATNEPTLDVIDSRDFFIAPGYQEIWDAPFCGIVTLQPLSWVRDNFPDVKEVKHDTVSGDDAEKAYKFGTTKSVNEYTRFVTVYEMWMRDDETYEEIVEVVEGEEKKSKKKKYPYGKICYFTEHQMLGTEAATDDHGRPPYVEMWDYIRPHNFIGMSEVSQIEGIHKEINVLLKYISEYTRRYHAPNYLVDMDQIEDESYEAIQTRLIEGNQVIPWSSSGGTRVPPVQQIEEGELNPQIMNLMSFLIEIIDIVSGVTDVSRGEVGKSERQSASEIAMLMESSNTRTRQRVRNLEWSLKRIAYLILRNVIQYTNEPKSMSYTEDGARTYFTYDNTFASAEQTMQPTPLNQSAQTAIDEGKPLVGNNEQELQRYEQEKKDYEMFLKAFSGKPDPIFEEFDIEIQTDSTLPMDKQARANLFLRLAQMKYMGPKKLYEQLQIPDAEGAVKELKEMQGGGKEQMLLKMLQQRGKQ